jgi:8-oxo-dGTP pyrophosphatase MutT (NUDIX family)
MDQQAVAAATVILLNESDAGLTVFMQERHRDSNAFSSMLVFPGGKLDAGDRDTAWRQHCQGCDAVDDTQLAYLVAAIREAFEESGVLYARRLGGEALLSGAQVAPLFSSRKGLQSGQLAFMDFVSEHSLVLACDALLYYAHWITPKFESRRFDTRFYLARVPEGQQGLLRHDGHELVDSLWIRPGDAVADAAAGRRKLIFPTIRNLERLAQYATVAAAQEACTAASVQTIEPVVDKRDDGVYVRIPTDAGYPVSEQRIPDELVAMLSRKS